MSTETGTVILGHDDFERPGTDAPPSSSWSPMSDYPYPVSLAGDGHTASVQLIPADNIGGSFWNVSEAGPDDVDVWATLGVSRSDSGGNEAFTLVACMTGDAGADNANVVKLFFWDDGMLTARVGGSNKGQGGSYNTYGPGDVLLLRVRRADGIVECWKKPIDAEWIQIAQWIDLVIPPGQGVGFSITNPWGGSPTPWTIDDFGFGHINMSEPWPPVSPPETSRQIRVKTLTGWTDLVIPGPEGPMGPEGPPGPGPNVSYSTFMAGPPSNPLDGDEWFADVEDGVCWQFRYKANSPSPYKWEFVGGPSIVRTLQGYGAYQAAIWTPFNGLAWTAQRPGEYESSGSWSGYTATSVSLGVGTMMNYGGGYNNPPVYSYTTQAAAWYFMLSVPKYVVEPIGNYVSTIAMGYWMSLAIAGTYAINHTIIPKRVG